MSPFIVQQKKDIFSKEIIAQRWTKQYNTCSNAADLDFVECEHNVEVDVMKYSEVSPCKKQKMSRHQKYRELMLLCKDFCDISSDLPQRDYNMIHNIIKDTTKSIKDGKTVVVKELSQIISSEDQKCKHIDPSTLKGVVTNGDINTAGLSSQNHESEYEEDKDISNDVKEVQDGSSDQVIEEDKQKVNKDKVEEGIQIQELIVDKEDEGICGQEIKEEKIDMLDVNEVEMQEIKEECKMEEGLHMIHVERSTEPSQTQQIQKISTECNEIKCTNPSTFSYLKHLPNQNFEVLKNVHLQKKCKQHGRPSKKRAALSFASASTVKKSKPGFGIKSCEQNISSTHTCSKGQNIHNDTCNSQVELPNHAEEKINIKPSLLQVVTQSDSWLDDQVIKTSMDILKNQYPMFRGFHNLSFKYCMFITITGSL